MSVAWRGVARQLLREGRAGLVVVAVVMVVMVAAHIISFTVSRGDGVMRALWARERVI